MEKADVATGYFSCLCCGSMTHALVSIPFCSACTESVLPTGLRNWRSAKGIPPLSPEQLAQVESIKAHMAQWEVPAAQSLPDLYECTSEQCGGRWELRRGDSSVSPVCPECQGKVRFVQSGSERRSPRFHRPSYIGDPIVDADDEFENGIEQSSSSRLSKFYGSGDDGPSFDH